MCVFGQTGGLVRYLVLGAPRPDSLNNLQVSNINKIPVWKKKDFT